MPSASAGARPDAAPVPFSSATGSRPRRSMADRKDASVLPEPVGAMTRAFSPRPIAAQARSCTGVGPAGKALRNQVRVAGENPSQPGSCGPATAGSPTDSVTAITSSRPVSPTILPRGCDSNSGA